MGVGFLVGAHRCNIAIFPHDIVLQSVSTCYNPVIQQEGPALIFSKWVELCVRRATAYKGDSQCAIHVITVRLDLQVPRGHVPGVNSLSHSVGHPGNIWNWHRLNVGPNKESSAILWVYQAFELGFDQSPAHSTLSGSPPPRRLFITAHHKDKAKPGKGNNPSQSD